MADIYDLSTPHPSLSSKHTDTSKYLLCVECEDVPAAVKCQQCNDVLCGLCFEWLHKRGTRATHQKIEIQSLPNELRSDNKQTLSSSLLVEKEEKVVVNLEPQMADPLTSEGDDIEGTTKHFIKTFEAQKEEMCDDFSHTGLLSFCFCFLFSSFLNSSLYFFTSSLLFSLSSPLLFFSSPPLLLSSPSNKN
jgi:hypothetical protein